jgi:hypothetical protein
MNARLIVVGGIAFYIVTWLVSFVSGPLIHNGVLAETYRATACFWRPALMQEPPDMAALLPRWIATGLLLSFILAALYGWVRSAIAGRGWKRGAKFGFGVFLLVAGVMASYSGFFNLPDRVWVWWSVDSLIGYLLGGAALGWAADRWAPAGNSR